MSNDNGHKLWVWQEGAFIVAQFTVFLVTTGSRRVVAGGKKGPFRFMIQRQNSRGSVVEIYSNMCDSFSLSDRKREETWSVFLWKMRTTARCESNMCSLLWTWKTQNMERKDIKAWNKRSFPGIINLLHTYTQRYTDTHLPLSLSALNAD